MTLTINHNLTATNASRNLATHYAELSVSTRRLSSGLRIGTASDDAAGLAVRELMRADISTLNQGVRNANDAISLIQTADGALSVIDEKLIRMKELAEQASTGTYNSDQRIIIDSEYQAMANEITRIANSTDFNGIHLLNGNLSGSLHDGSGLASTGKLKVHFGTGNDSAEDYYYLQIGNCTASALGFGGTGQTIHNFSQAEILAANPGSYYLGWALWQAGDTCYNSTPAAVRDQFVHGQTGNHYISAGGDRYVALLDDSGTQRVLHYNPTGTTYFGEGGFVVSSSSGVGSPPSSISTQELAQKALVTVQNAIVAKDKIRANLGAMQNRLENTIANQQIQAENLQAAESRISDVDVASEMTQFVREQILTQAATAMLAQANSLPRMALQLIGG